MAMPKVVLIFFVGAFLVSSLFVRDAEANEDRVIDNGAMARNTIIACSKAHPENCKRPIANPYRRGCQPEEKCRSGKNRQEET
ncbi:Protein RALF-like 15, partial [Mucuna pruriens]